MAFIGVKRGGFWNNSREQPVDRRWNTTWGGTMEQFIDGSQMEPEM
jgi:hypothetical protein